jgi:hypothetical protein
MNDGCWYDRHNQNTLCAPLSLPLAAPGPAMQCERWVKPLTRREATSSARFG